VRLSEPLFFAADAGVDPICINKRSQRNRERAMKKGDWVVVSIGRSRMNRR